MSENEYRCYPDSSSPGSDAGSNSENKPEIRRGRPKAAMISHLMTEGATSQSGIRCEVCSRVFPRDKSLQAHRRVHTGERPYSCDYPGCLRKFKQSGQLKTHQRLHTGERPFVCSVEGCTSRFTHANRHCSNHPQASLVRSEDTNVLFVEKNANSEDVRQWLAKYRAEKETKSVEKKDPLSTPVSTKCLDFLTPKSEEPQDINSYTNSILDRELADMTNFTNANPVQPVPGGAGSLPWSPIKSPLRLSPVKTPRISTPDRSRPVKSLFLADQPASLNVSPRKRELPKKRWLRIASRELASYANVSPSVSANLNRPTVLRHAAEFTSPVVTSTSFATPMATPQLLHNLLTPPYSDEKQRRYQEEDEELAVPLPGSEADHSLWYSAPEVYQ